MVAARGIGIFFGLMIFCKKAPIEECIHYLPRIQFAKKTQRAFAFGRHLKFGREEYHSNYVRNIMLPDPKDDPEAEVRRLWPGPKIDLMLQYHGGQFAEPQVATAADKLTASLFYIEPELVPLVWPALTISIAIVVKCRLPPGLELANLIMRLRIDKAKFEFGGHEQRRYFKVCPSSVWARIRAGRSFERVVYVRVASDDIEVRCSMKLGGLYRRLSNCPVRLCDLIAAHPTCRIISRRKNVVVDKIEEMENCLHSFLI